MVPAALKYLALLSLCLLLNLFNPYLSHALEVEAITKPSQDISLSFIQHGKIHEVMVRKGDYVESGDLLVSLEAQEKMIQYQQLTARANEMTVINIAQAELLQKEKDLQQMQKAKGNGAVTDWEVDHARLAVETAMLEVKLAKFEHAQDHLRLQELKTVLNNLHIRSPIQGVVEEVTIEKGESVQALFPVIRVVNIEDLSVDIAVPVSKTKSLVLNQKAVLKFADENQVEGRIDNIASVIDSAANTLRIGVIAPNPDNRPAGERVTVSFPDVE